MRARREAASIGLLADRGLWPRNAACNSLNSAPASWRFKRRRFLQTAARKRLQTARAKAVGILASHFCERRGVDFHGAAPAAEETAALERLAALRAAFLLCKHVMPADSDGRR